MQVEAGRSEGQSHPLLDSLYVCSLSFNVKKHWPIQLKVGKGVFQQLKAASEAETTDKPLLTDLVSMVLST